MDVSPWCLWSPTVGVVVFSTCLLLPNLLQRHAHLIAAWAGFVLLPIAWLVWTMQECHPGAFISDLLVGDSASARMLAIIMPLIAGTSASSILYVKELRTDALRKLEQLDAKKLQEHEHQVNVAAAGGLFACAAVSTLPLYPWNLVMAPHLGVAATIFVGGTCWAFLHSRLTGVLLELYSDAIGSQEPHAWSLLQQLRSAQAKQRVIANIAVPACAALGLCAGIGVYAYTGALDNILSGEIVALIPDVEKLWLNGSFEEFCSRSNTTATLERLPPSYAQLHLGLYGAALCEWILVMTFAGMMETQSGDVKALIALGNQLGAKARKQQGRQPERRKVTERCG